MFFNSLFEKDSTALLRNMQAFTGAKHNLLTNDIANVDTPFYRPKFLSTKKFQASLRRAVEDRNTDHPRRLEMRRSRELGVHRNGALEFIPRKGAAQGIYRYDHNTVDIERTMSELGKNSMMHKTFTSLLGKKFRMLEGAIREKM